MTEQFKINRAGEPAKEKHLLWWLQSNKQRPINICPPLHQDLLEMVGNFPFAVFLLSFKSVVQCFLWTQYQAIVCGPVNRSINCSDSEAFPPMCWLWRLENNKWGRKKACVFTDTPQIFSFSHFYSFPSTELNQLLIHTPTDVEWRENFSFFQLCLVSKIRSIHLGNLQKSIFSI